MESNDAEYQQSKIGLKDLTSQLFDKGSLGTSNTAKPLTTSVRLIVIEKILNPDWKEHDQHIMVFYMEAEDDDLAECDESTISAMWIECDCGLLIGNLQADPTLGGAEAIHECYERLHGGEETLYWEPSLYFR